MSTTGWDDGSAEGRAQALTDADVQRLLGEGAEVTPCLEAGLADLKALRAACLGAGIPALIGAPDACGSGGKCSTKAQLLVRDEDVPRVQGLLRQRWEDSVRALGVEPVAGAPVPGLLGGPGSAGAPGDEAEGDLPCPACGTAAPLVEGACSDCGLQLE